MRPPWLGVFSNSESYGTGSTTTRPHSGSGLTVRLLMRSFMVWGHAETLS